MWFLDANEITLISLQKGKLLINCILYKSDNRLKRRINETIRNLKRRKMMLYLFLLSHTIKSNHERFHLLLFSIKDSIFPIHMIGKFCYKEDKRWVLTYFINRKFHVFNRKFHVLNRNFMFFTSNFEILIVCNSDAIDAKYH